MPLTNKILIVIALIVGLWLRLFNLSAPVADWHSHRQADTASVTKIYSSEGLDLLHPRYHDLSDVQSGSLNPQGYRMVEFPIYNTISYYFHRIFQTNVDVSSRLVSIILSLGSSLLILAICFKYTRNFTPSFAAMVIFLILPFNVYYSRTILPEPTAVFFMLLSLYLFDIQILFSALALALAILIKPYTAIILFPALLLLTYYRLNKSKNLKFNLLSLISFAVISLFPFFLWRLWIGQYPEGIPKSDWLLNNGVSNTFPNWYHGYNLTFLNKLIAFRPHWFVWLFQERLGDLILGIYGLIPVFLGLAYKKNRIQAISFSLVLGILLYFVIVAQGNIQHDYYQVLIVPFVAILYGLGLYYLSQYVFTSQVLSLIMTFCIMGLSLFLSYEQVKNYYTINNSRIISAGAKAQELLPPNSLVIAPYQGDTAFLYQTGFKGWPAEVHNLPEIINQFPGQTFYLISINFDDYTNNLISRYPEIYRSNDFVILNLSI